MFRRCYLPEQERHCGLKVDGVILLTIDTSNLQNGTKR